MLAAHEMQNSIRLFPKKNVELRPEIHESLAKAFTRCLLLIQRMLRRSLRSRIRSRAQCAPYCGAFYPKSFPNLKALNRFNSPPRADILVCHHRSRVCAHKKLSLFVWVSGPRSRSTGLLFTAAQPTKNSIADEKSPWQYVGIV